MKRSTMLVLAASLVAAGCAAHAIKTETGNPIQKDNVARIQDGKTTIDDVLALFGAPTSETEVAGKKLLVWKHCKTSGGTMGILGLGGTSTTQRCNTLTVNVDLTTGKVVNHNYQKLF